MTWQSRITNDPAVQTAYYLHIAGIRETPTTIPFPGGFFPAVSIEMPGLLDPTNLKDIPAQALNRKSGAASPTTLSFRLGPDTLAGQLRKLFATRLATMNEALLTVTANWTAAQIFVDSVAGFPGAGYLHVGRELIKYTGLGAASFTGCTRGQGGSVAWKFPVDDSLAKGTRRVTDHPTVWEGRVVWLTEVVCNSAGVPLDSLSTGTNQREIWRGTIQGVRPADNWAWWEIECRSIDASLDTEILGGLPTGKLADNVSEADANAGAAYNNGMMAALVTHAYVVAGLNEIPLAVRFPSSQWSYLTPVLVPGMYADVMQAVVTAVQTALSAAGAPWNAYTWKCYQFASMIDLDGNPSLTWKHTLQIHVYGAAVNSEWTFSLDVTDACVLRLCGFAPGPDTSTAWADVNGRALGQFSAAELPPLYYLSAAQTNIWITEEVDGGGSSPIWPATGYAMLTVGDLTECIQYAGITELTTTAPRKLLLTGCTRGRLGTQPLAVSIPGQLGLLGGGAVQMQTQDEPPTIRYGLGFAGVGILTLALRLMLSSGSAGLRHATYDMGYGDYLCAALDAAGIDVARFEEIETSLPALFKTRTLFFSKPFNLRTWLGTEFAALGLQLGSRLTPAGFQLTLDRVQDASVVALRTLDGTNLALDEWPHLEGGLGLILNRVEMQLAWNVGKEKFEDQKILFNALDSQIDLGVVQAETLKLSGLTSPGGAVIDQATSAAVAAILSASILSHFANRYEIVTLRAGKACWAWRPGEGVAVTLPGPPNWDGTRGWVAEPMGLLAVERALAGTGRSALAKLTLLHQGDRRLSYYVPSGYVTAYAGGPPVTITVQANYYTTATQTNPATGQPANDVDWFAVNDVIRVQLPGDEETGVERTITAKVGQILTLDAALPVGLQVNPTVCYPSWATANARQRGWVYVADAATLLLGGTTPPFQYAG